MGGKTKYMLPRKNTGEAENKRMGTHVTQTLTKRKLTILRIDK